jgi:hypothetical protein
MKNLTLLAVAMVCASLAGPRTAAADPRRFAVFVGSNIGDRHEDLLHHAEDDAVRVAQTLRTLGDFPADQVFVLNGVTAPELRDAILRLNMRIHEQPEAVLVVFYSGHADAEALHLAGTHFPLAELKALLVGSPATSRVLVVDACRSGSLIGLKGAHPTQPFPVAALDEPAPQGFAVLTSSTATESAQESASLGGSFFTYYLNSGLLGAADQDRDGAVTLSELYAFASSETRAATVSSPVGQQTPAFQFMLGGKHDLVLTRPGRRDVRMGMLEFAEAGRYVVQPWNDGVLGAPIAEMAAHEPGARLALPPGHYHVTRRGQRDIAERDADVMGGETSILASSSMSRVDLGRVVRKGDLRRSATGFAMLAGWRSNEPAPDTMLGGALEMGSGPTLLATLRHDRRRFSLEGRLGLERETVSTAFLRIENQALTLAAAGLIPFDLRLVTLSLGFELGWVLVRQSYSPTSDGRYLALTPASPALMHPSWSDGLQLGPLAQMDVPLRGQGYLRLEAAVPYRYFSSAFSWPNDNVQVRKGAHLHLVVGAGISF